MELFISSKLTLCALLMKPFGIDSFIVFNSGTAVFFSIV